MATVRSHRLSALSASAHRGRLASTAAIPGFSAAPTPASVALPTATAVADPVASPAAADPACSSARIAPAAPPTPAEPMAATSEPAPGSPEALALLASLGIAPPAAAGAPLGPDDQRFSPIANGHLTHRLVEVKPLLDQLGAEQKELHDTLRLAHLRGDLRHLLPPGGEGGYQLPCGVQLHRRAGRRQWQYGPEVQELEAQFKAQQVYEQGKGQALWSLELRSGTCGFGRGEIYRLLTPVALAIAGLFCWWGGAVTCPYQRRELSSINGEEMQSR